MSEENVCDLFDELKYYRARQAVLRSALREIERLRTNFDDEMCAGPEVSVMENVIQDLEYACADIEAEVVQMTKKN